MAQIETDAAFVARNEKIERLVEEKIALVEEIEQMRAAFKMILEYAEVRDLESIRLIAKTGQKKSA